MIRSLIIDPELEKFMIPLDPESKQGLKRLLIENGYEKEYPIVVWAGRNIIVDGHHRYAFCKELDIEPVISEVPFESKEHAIIYAAAHQKSRRNATSGQLALIGIAQYGAEERIKARERQSELNRSSAVLPAQAQEAKGESAAIIAEKSGVKTRNIYEMRAVKEKGVPEVEAFVMKEGLSSVAANEFVQRTPKDEQAEIVKRGVEAVKERARKTKAERVAKCAAKKELEKKLADMKERAQERRELEEYKEVLTEQYGGAKYACGLSSVNELWCNDCNTAFDVFKPAIAISCPVCASKNIDKRDESWYPGKRS